MGGDLGGEEMREAPTVGEPVGVEAEGKIVDEDAKRGDKGLEEGEVEGEGEPEGITVKFLERRRRRGFMGGGGGGD